MKKSLGAETLICPTPVFVIGTYDERNRPNMATVAWGGICCSTPPCVAISLRKARYTYDNIVRTQAFTVNVPSVRHAKEADYVGIVSGREADKFAVTGLTAVPGQHVNAPYVKEFPLVAECKVLHTFELGVHTQFVGEILDVKVDEAVLDKEGHIDGAKLKAFVFIPGDHSYYRVSGLIGEGFAIGQTLNK